MNNQKDTQKTSLNSYGQGSVLDVKTLENKHARLDSSTARQVYDFANKKTEKLVTALYMVTDCMDTDDALKGKLRELGVELLSDIYKLSTFSPLDKQTHIISFLSRIEELISFVEIAYTIGFISEMNTTILKKEFMILVGELENHQKSDKHFTFSLDREMFEVGEVKRTLSDNMSFTNNKSPLPTFQPHKLNHSGTNLADRHDRTEKILNLIKDLSRDKAGEKDIAIKDISLAFTDCSEKTIQRELNALVLKGQLKKTGAKRWSRYQAVIK